MKNLAPIVLFVYNRPNHTLKTIEALKKNYLSKNSILYIFSDGAKNKDSLIKVKEVRQILKNITGFKKVIIENSSKNKGLANSVIYGVSKIIKEYGKVIVLEDDLITSYDFLEYMNEALDFYKNNEKIWAISGYAPPIKIPENYNKDIYLSYSSSSWGYATWENRWNKTDWEISDYKEFIKNRIEKKLFKRGGNNKVLMLKDQKNGYIDSWAIRWLYSQYKDSSYCIYPVLTKINNLGIDGSGTHSNRIFKNKKKYNSKLSNKNIEFVEDISIDYEIIKKFRKFYNLSFKNYIGIFLKKLKLYKKIIKSIR